jgi:hypothetical protein
MAMSTHIHTHAEAPELTVAHGNQQEPEYQRLQRLESSVSVRQPLLKLNEKRCTMSLSFVIKNLPSHREVSKLNQSSRKQQALGQKLSIALPELSPNSPTT